MVNHSEFFYQITLIFWDKHQLIVRVCVLSCVQLFAAPWTAAHQAPLPMDFSKQEYWNGMLFSSPGDTPNPGIEPISPALAGRFFTTSTTWEAQVIKIISFLIHY